MISGSRDTQVSADGWNYESRISLGACTQAIIEILRSHNHKISLESLIRNLHLWMKERKYAQRPNVSCSQEDGINHVIQKPTRSNEPCLKCEEYKKELNLLNNSYKEITQQVDDSKKENITVWYENKKLSERINQLQKVVNTYMVPEERKNRSKTLRNSGFTKKKFK